MGEGQADAARLTTNLITDAPPSTDAVADVGDAGGVVDQAVTGVMTLAAISIAVITEIGAVAAARLRVIGGSRVSITVVTRRPLLCTRILHTWSFGVPWRARI